ncbi:MAG: hypothetical protein A2939_02695 [Parcubacteria group bacterium RIFCSPLOWO2_01_FULL_48_18]|nr:MAG: hypothetical protein A2939_02695 [Parcubacteria group bacterium RIFCSPLOWO2_01_FULL_48_18]OHB22996.1 MAG: hypothetical protein A3J67_03830 [Parcubacteria group bacterium RIFCSPHIGHO2_02_FULL_48_10b]
MGAEKELRETDAYPEAYAAPNIEAQRRIEKKRNFMRGDSPIDENVAGKPIYGRENNTTAAKSAASAAIQKLPAYANNPTPIKNESIA